MTKVHVGPDQDPRIAEAVEAGGGTLVPLADAEALVWLESDPTALRDALHEGIRWVQLPAAGVESFVDAGLVEPGRTLTSAAGAYADTVAEHTVALILAGTRRLHECARATGWTAPDVGVLAGATVAIVGAGGIGQALIRMLQPFRVRVVAVTRSGRDVPGADLSLGLNRLDQVWPDADWVVVAAPSTPQTRHLVGREQLAAMQPHAWVCNIARGSLVDTEALTEALAAGRMGGAALDVTDPEPLPSDHPLWREPRALITPHCANPASALRRALAERVRENVARYRDGRDLEAVIDPDAGY